MYPYTNTKDRRATRTLIILSGTYGNPNRSAIPIVLAPASLKMAEMNKTAAPNK